MSLRPLSSAILLLGGLAFTSPALALGFGRMPTSIALGQPLDLSVPLRLDGGAVPGCLQAQVQIGEHRVPPGELHVGLEGGDALRVRIRSAVVVREPAVVVRLSIGCSGPVSRQFAVLADPARLPAAAESPPIAPAVERRLPVPGAVRASSPPRGVARPLPRMAPHEAGAAPDAPAPAPAPADHAALSSALQAASAAQQAASAAERQLRAATAEIGQLRAQATAQSDLLTQLRTRLKRADEPNRLQAALIAFVVSLGLVVSWLGWRLRSAGRVAPVPPQDEADTAPTLLAATSLPLEAPAPTAGRYEPEPARTGDVDALIDLEQEVEFYALLGDDAAAIGLLDVHLQTRGDASPLPHLQLLRMQRRQPDRPAYERAAARFGQCFGVPPPDWDTGVERGRGLEHCPAALAELQACWGAPSQALAWLEQRLLGAPGSESPGLQAYQELLMLYTIARDLQRSAEPADVDLLLPLAGSDDLVATLRPSIFDALPPGPAERRPAGALDLDLGLPAQRA